MRWRLLVVLTALGAGACSTLIGLGDFHDAPAGKDASAPGGAAGSDASSTGGAAGAAGAGASGGTGGTGGSMSTGGSGGSAGSGGTAGSGGSGGCANMGAAKPVATLDADAASGARFVLIQDETGGPSRRVFAAVGANGTMSILGIRYAQSALHLDMPATTVYGKGNPQAGRTEFVHATQSSALDVYTDTGQQVCFSLSPDAGAGLVNVTCDYGLGLVCARGTLTALAYDQDATSRVFTVSTCDGSGYRDLDVGGGVASSGSANEDDLLVRRDALIGINGDAGFMRQHAVVMGGSSNQLRGVTSLGSVTPVHAFNLGTGDAGTQSSMVLGMWELPNQPHITQVGIVGLLTTGGSTTLYSGIAGESDLLDPASLMTSQGSITSVSTASPSAFSATPGDAWWAGPDSSGQSVLLFHFKTTTAKLLSSDYQVYKLPTQESGSAQVTLAAAAPFFDPGNPSALTPVLVMWAEQSGGSTTIYAQAVKCGP